MTISYKKIGEVISAPFLPGKLGEEKHIVIKSPIKKSEYKKEGRTEANDLCMVVDLDYEDQNAQFVLVVSAIMKSELEKKYPKNSYVGKGFSFTRFPKQSGGKASPIALQELILSIDSK